MPNFPKIKLGGTPGICLIDSYARASGSLSYTIRTLINCTAPRECDYPDDVSFNRAMDEHKERVTTLMRIRRDLDALTDSVKDQLDQKSDLMTTKKTQEKSMVIKVYVDVGPQHFEPGAPPPKINIGEPDFSHIPNELRITAEVLLHDESLLRGLDTSINGEMEKTRAELFGGKR